MAAERMRRRILIFALGLLAFGTPTLMAEDVSLWPLFVYHHDEDDLEIEVLWPAFGLERRGESQLAVHVLWPLTGFLRQGEQRHRWIFPLLFWGRQAPDRRYGVLVPLAGMLPDRGLHWFGNVVHRDFGNRQLWGVLPLWWERSPDRWAVGAPPLYFSVAEGRLRSAMLIPVAWWRDREHWGLFPLIWRHGEWVASFPVFGRHLGHHDTWYFLFPLYVHTVDHESVLEHFLWPFFAYGSDSRGNAYGVRWRVWPLVGHRNHIWAHGAIPRRVTTYLLWPFVWRHRTWNRRGDLQISHLVGAPAFLSFGLAQEDGFERTTWVPPLLSFWSSHGGGLRRLAVVFPLYLQRWRGDGSTTWRFLWEVAMGRIGEDKAEVRLLWRLFRHTRDGERLSGELFPLIFWTRDRARDTTDVTFLWRFLQWRREGDQRRLRLLFSPSWIPLGEERGGTAPAAVLDLSGEAQPRAERAPPPGR
jgi:hypothetical protein